MITIELVYRLAGIAFLLIAAQHLRDRKMEWKKRGSNALFWGAYAVSLLFGSKLPDFANGCIVIVIVLVGGLGGVSRSPQPEETTAEEREASAVRFKNKLFVPALVVPVLTLVSTYALRGVRAGELPLFDPKNLSLIALGLSAMVALVVALLMLRQPVRAAAREHRRLMDLIGWAAVLPQMLASLGAIFAAAGVGDRIAELLGRVVPLDQRFAVVCAFSLGMALFTVIMGNAFAAFPMMVSALGIPIIVRRFGGDPAVMAAIGMLCGFCGTLMTPMAANFNIVPAALLELPDKHGVIRAQLPTALVLLAGNTLLLYFLGFR